MCGHWLTRLDWLHCSYMTRSIGMLNSSSPIALCMKYLKVLVLGRRIKGSWKRWDVFGSHNDAELHELKKFSPLPYLEQQIHLFSCLLSLCSYSLDRQAQLDIWGCSAAHMRVLCYVSHVKNHVKEIKTLKVFKRMLSELFKMLFLELPSYWETINTDLYRTAQEISSLHHLFPMGFFSCQHVNSERTWSPHQLAHWTGMTFAPEFGSSPRW